MSGISICISHLDDSATGVNVVYAKTHWRAAVVVAGVDSGVDEWISVKVTVGVVKVGMLCSRNIDKFPFHLLSISKYFLLN